jgi:hypothetical protein
MDVYTLGVLRPQDTIDKLASDYCYWQFFLDWLNRHGGEIGAGVIIGFEVVFCSHTLLTNAQSIIAGKTSEQSPIGSLNRLTVLPAMHAFSGGAGNGQTHKTHPRHITA